MFFFSQVLPTPDDGDLLLDFSKNRINAEALSLLFDLVSGRKKAISQQKNKAKLSGLLCLWFVLSLLFDLVSARKNKAKRSGILCFNNKSLSAPSYLFLKISNFQSVINFSWWNNQICGLLCPTRDLRTQICDSINYNLWL